MIYIDTHVAAWLYASGAELLSPEAHARLEAEDDLRISPMVRLELHYLYEIERTTVPGASVVDALRTSLGLRVCEAAFPAVAAHAEKMDWTRDPFDRLIVAQAAIHGAALITKDGAIRDAYEHAVW